MAFELAKGFFRLSVLDETPEGLKNVVHNIHHTLNSLTGITIWKEILEEPLKEGIQEAINAEFALARLGSALQLAGVDGRKAAEEFEKLAHALAQTSGQSKVAVLETMTLIANKTKLAGAELEKATIAAMGLARAFGIDSVTAAQALSQAILGKTRFLSQYGIVVDESKTQQEQLNELLDKGMQSFNQFGDTLDTTKSKIAQLKESYGELLETLGTGVTGDLTKGLMDGLNNWLTGASEELKGLGDGKVGWGATIKELPGTLLARVQQMLGIDHPAAPNPFGGLSSLEDQKSQTLGEVGAEKRKKMKEEIDAAKARAAETQIGIQKDKQAKEQAKRDEEALLRLEKEQTKEREKQAELAAKAAKTLLEALFSTTGRERGFSARDYQIQTLRARGKDKDADRMQVDLDHQKRLAELEKQRDEATAQRRSEIQAQYDLREAAFPAENIFESVQRKAGLAKALLTAGSDVGKEFAGVMSREAELYAAEVAKVNKPDPMVMQDMYRLTVSNAATASIGAVFGFAGVREDINLQRQSNRLLEKIADNTRPQGIWR